MLCFVAVDVFGVCGCVWGKFMFMWEEGICFFCATNSGNVKLKNLRRNAPRSSDFVRVVVGGPWGVTKE